MSYQPKTYRKQGGDEFVVADGGVLNIQTGGIIAANGTQGSALTVQLTSITHTAPGTPDYAIQNLVQNTGFGFVTADEGNTVLSVILNLQARLAQVEARLEAVGLVAAN
jgi:hypothetical protein